MKFLDAADRWLGLAWKVAIVGACVWFIILHDSCTRSDLVIGPVRQDVVLGPLPASAMTNPAALLQSVNDYRTASGWISSSNDRIWAGLSNRVWSAPYETSDYRHEVTLWAGAGYGISYQYALFDHWTVGGSIFRVGDQTAAMGGVGYRW